MTCDIFTYVAILHSHYRVLDNLLPTGTVDRAFLTFICLSVEVLHDGFAGGKLICLVCREGKIAR